MLACSTALAQSGRISGVVTSDGEPLEFANVGLTGTSYGSPTDAQGRYSISKLSTGDYQVTVSAVGYETQHRTITLTESQSSVTLNIRSARNHFHAGRSSGVGNDEGGV